MMLKKLLAMTTSMFFIAVGLVAMPAMVAPATAAPSASAFDPGLIISDSVFFDFGSMSVPQIQSFLDSKVTDCRATDPSLSCLESFVGDIPEVPATTSTETGPCLAIQAKSGATAAEMIFAIANSCGISPKVLLTTLQKEQGLVTSTKPTEYMYRAAMGFGCPDSDPGICGKVYVGLFNQVYRAAKQFRWYGNPAGSFTYWKPGRTVSMRYNPKSSCGTKSIVMKSQATANLYYYTPYTPNDAAMANLYGTGDSCSAYGNRNFWRFYHDWFGSPIGGGYLLKAGGADTYLIVDNLKYRVSDARLIASLLPLGPIGEISQPYLDSFVTSGEMTQLVKNKDSGAYNLLVDGVKYQVSDCSMAAQFGSSCDAAITLTASQLNVFPDGGALNRLVQSGETKYWIENGTSRVVVDDMALASVGALNQTPTKMTLEQVSALQPGPALASELLMFGIAGSSDAVIASGGQAYRFSSSVVAETGLASWFDQSDVKVAASAIAEQVTLNMVRGFVQSTSGASYVITAAGKLPITDPIEWSTSFITLPDAILGKIPTVSGELSAPAVVSYKASTSSFFVQSAQRRTSTSTTMTAEFLSLIGQPKAIEIPLDAIKSITHAGLGLAPGVIVKESGTSTLYLIDDLSRRVKLASSSQASSVSDSKTYSISKSNLAKFEIRTGFTSVKVQCDGAAYLLDNGTIYPISPAAVANYPGKAFPLSLATCSSFNEASKPVGQFIRDSKKAIYFVEGGTKTKLRNWSHYLSVVGDGPGYVYVSDYFASKIPTSGTTPASVILASAENIPTGTFTELVFSGSVPDYVAPVTTPTPSPVATPTISPTPSATPTPTPPSSPSTSAPATYTVVAGDTLNAIASRFGVSSSSLQALNNISDPRLLRIGQVLKIPGTGGSITTPTPTPTQTPTPTATPTPMPTPTPKAPTNADVSVSYRVASGDTLWKISSKFGVTVASIQELNGITNPAYIRVGQLIQIPTTVSESSVPVVTPVSPETESSAPVENYRVVSGDTLWGIARKLGVSSADLAKLNQINNANYIRVGQLLKVPN